MGAADWVKEKLALYGLAADEDAWDETIPGLGRVRLRNLTTVIPGSTPDAILVLAHRDDIGTGPGANDNASGTAALIELARGYGTLSTAAAGPKPMHTLIFLSSDGGAFGGYGAERFARRRRFRGRSRRSSRSTGSPGTARPRLELAGFEPRSPTPALLRTADVRIARPARAAARTARLARPARRSRRAVRLRRAGAVPRAPDLRVRLSTAADDGRDASADTTARLDPARFVADRPRGRVDPLLARRRHRARRRHGRARLPRRPRSSAAGRSSSSCSSRSSRSSPARSTSSRAAGAAACRFARRLARAPGPVRRLALGRAPRRARRARRRVPTRVGDPAAPRQPCRHRLAGDRPAPSRRLAALGWTRARRSLASVAPPTPEELARRLRRRAARPRRRRRRDGDRQPVRPPLRAALALRLALAAAAARLRLGARPPLRGRPRRARARRSSRSRASSGSGSTPRSMSSR